jgi:hypothetical protein
MFKVSKNYHQDFSLLHTYYICYTSFFGVKNGSPIMCFHPFVECFGFSTCFLFTYLFLNFKKSSMY